jgi:hypothetical protein
MSSMEISINSTQQRALRAIASFNTRGRPGAAEEIVFGFKGVRPQTIKALQRRGLAGVRKPKAGQKGAGERFFYLTPAGRRVVSA